MAKLLCETHGTECLEDYLRQAQSHFAEGGGVMLTSGELAGGPYCCDACKKVLPKGATAFLVNYFTQEMIATFDEYDFAEEVYFFDRNFASDDIHQFGFTAPLPEWLHT